MQAFGKHVDMVRHEAIGVDAERFDDGGVEEGTEGVAGGDGVGEMREALGAGDREEIGGAAEIVERVGGVVVDHRRIHESIVE
ncbi:MAG: hypothetical protein WBL50_13125 [Candidatus Acidiferrum sp.]